MCVCVSPQAWEKPVAPPASPGELDLMDYLLFIIYYKLKTWLTNAEQKTDSLSGYDANRGKFKTEASTKWH